MSKRPRLLVALSAAGLLLALTEAIGADPIASCIEQLTGDVVASSHQPFSTDGLVVCPPAESIGDPPVARRHDAETLLTWRAPPGMVVDLGSLEVVIQNTRNGTHEAPTAEGNTVRLRLTCRGLQPGEGEAFHRVTLKGEIFRPLTPDMRSEIAADCRRRQERASNRRRARLASGPPFLVHPICSRKSRSMFRAMTSCWICEVPS
jgi:hypothetical protein